MKFKKSGKNMYNRLFAQKINVIIVQIVNEKIIAILEKYNYNKDIDVRAYKNGGAPGEVSN